MFEKSQSEAAAPAIIEAPAPVKDGPLVVLKYFHSESRRFRIGDPIAPDDLKGSRLDFEHMKSRGYIGTQS